jgi:hypothetical protein
LIDSIHHLNSNNEYGAIGSVVNGPYYDIFALRNEECNYNCWEKVFQYSRPENSPYKHSEKIPIQERMNWNDAVEMFVSFHKKNYSKYSELIEVDSAFGGAMVYKTSVLSSSLYEGITVNGDEVCEHVPLCYRIKKLGYKILLNPEFIIY